MRQSGRSTSSNADVNRPSPCRFFQRGKCIYGSKCRNSHGGDDTRQEDKKLAGTSAAAVPEMFSAIDVVARHVARAGADLEQACRRAVKAQGVDSADPGIWRFLLVPGSAEHGVFHRTLAKKRADYAHLRREPATEHEINRCSASKLVPDNAAPVPSNRIWLSLRGFEAQEGHSADAGAGPGATTPIGQSKAAKPIEEDLNAAAKWLEEHREEVMGTLVRLGENPAGRIYAGCCFTSRAKVVMAEVEAAGRAHDAMLGSTDSPQLLKHVGGWVATAGPPSPGTRMRLPIEDIHFAHDSQSEKFHHPANGPHRHTVLQTALELLSGQLLPEQLKDFSVCWHNGRWHSRTGNRRLMAYRLVRLHAPERFKEVNVVVGETSENWLSEKYSAVKNGHACNGAWIKVRETGEFVGRENASFGKDLFDLILHSGR